MLNRRSSRFVPEATALEPRLAPTTVLVVDNPLNNGIGQDILPKSLPLVGPDGGPIDPPPPPPPQTTGTLGTVIGIIGGVVAGPVIAVPVGGVIGAATGK